MLKAIKSALKRNRFIVDTYRKLRGINANKFLIGMTRIEERDFWEKYGKKMYSGTGEIVDLGCWLGSTTVPLVKGLLDNPKFDAKKHTVYAYDLFVWDDWMDPYIEYTFLKGKYKAGDDFMPAYKEIIHPYRKFIKVVKADLTKTKWTSEPIEFLLIDAMKTWELSNSILTSFYPYLIPGKSVIVHQDFAHYHTYWIHLVQFRLKEYFELVEDILGGSTAFKLIKEIPAELIKNYSISDFSAEEIERAFDYSLSISLKENQSAVIAAKVMCYHDLRGKEFAKNLLNEILTTRPKHNDLITVSTILER